MKKFIFANIIIVACITLSAAVTVAVVYELHRLDNVVTEVVVMALLVL